MTGAHLLADEFKIEAVSSKISISGRLQSWVRAWRRRRRLQSVALKFDGHNRPINSNGRIIAITPPHMFIKMNGLGRAYRYLIYQLGITEVITDDPSLLQPGPEPICRVLICGQPDHYAEIFSNTPDWLRQAYRIGVWVTEFEKPPAHWELARNIVHEVWTPSTFSANAIQRIFDGEIKIIPYDICLYDVPPMPRALFGISEDQFLGLAIMDLRTCPDRKNPLAHIRAWKRAFRNDPNSILLIKANFSKRTQFMRREMIDEISESSNIRIIEKIYDHREFEAFQRMADVFVSLHRSEGYGLNIHEMLKMGIPTIATAYSGNMDYMAMYPHAFPVSFHMTPYNDRTVHYTDSGLRWAEASIDETVAILHDIKEDWQKKSIERSSR